MAADDAREEKILAGETAGGARVRYHASDALLPLGCWFFDAPEGPSVGVFYDAADGTWNVSINTEEMRERNAASHDLEGCPWLCVTLNDSELHTHRKGRERKQ